MLGLLLGSALLTTVAQRIGAPYPALLAIAGAALAFVPTTVSVELDPELALALFVAPTLLDAAFDASPRDLRANWRPVGSLVLVAVGLTVVAVAVVARLLVPGMPWAVAIVLGAIVAPPDASAAAAILRSVGPPHRVRVILEGESLLNDATALIIYRVGVAAAAGAALSVWSTAGLLLLQCVGGAAFGAAIAWAYARLLRPAPEIGVAVITQFISVFAVWIVADQLGLSSVLTTVAYAITLARLVPGTQSAERRRASYAVWEVAVFVLNALAFILIGLQFKGVLSRLDDHAAATGWFALAIFVTVVVVRIVWVVGYGALLRQTSTTLAPPLNGTMVVSWCGMRGIVTLATAFALPDGEGGGAVFPHRDLLVAAAFAVVLGTLVIQGLTLAPLMRWLQLDDDDAVAREVSLARAETARTAADILDSDNTPYADGLHQDYERSVSQESHALMLRVIAGQRRRLLQMRRQSTIGDNAYHVIEEELDWAEGHTARRLQVAAAATPVPPRRDSISH